MAQTTIAHFAADLKMPAGVLLEQFQKAGVAKSKADDLLSDQDKSRLLDYLRRSHGEAEGKTKNTLTRKETSVINSYDSLDTLRKIQLQLRKKHVLVKRKTVEEELEDHRLAGVASPLLEELKNYLQVAGQPHLWMPLSRWVAMQPEERSELRWVMYPYAAADKWLLKLDRERVARKKAEAALDASGLNLNGLLIHEKGVIHPTAPDLGKPVPRSAEYEAAMRARLADDDEDESSFVVAEMLEPLADFKTSGVEKLSSDKFLKPVGRAIPDSTVTTVMQYRRDASVRAWVLSNARGVCECCKQDAPFKGADGLPYLEVHHVRQLAACGSDTVSNTVAICPNCHRELHFGEKRHELVHHLLETVVRLVRE